MMYYMGVFMFGRNNVQKNFKKQMKEIEKELKTQEKQDEGVLSNNLFKLRFYGYNHNSRKVRFGRLFSGGIFSIIGILIVIRIIMSTVSFFLYGPINNLNSNMVSSYYSGDYSQTIRYSDKMLRKDEDNYIALLYKAKSLRALERYDEALDCIRTLESTWQENDSEILKEYGNCYADLGQHNEAISYYESAMEVDPYDSMIASALGWEYYYTGESTKASEYAQKAIILNNENMDAKRLINQLERESSEKASSLNKEQAE